MDALKLMTAKDTLIFFSSKPSYFYDFYTGCDKGLQYELIWVGDDCCTDLNGLLGATWVRTEEEGGALLAGSFLSSYGLMARGPEATAPSIWIV